jgi:polyhydroxyalkanoate synthesis regulator phasin
MENIFKKFLHTGVGFISIASEKFKNAIDELVKDGKLSEAEGKKRVEEFMSQSEDRKKEFDKEFGNAIENILKNFKFAKKEDLDKLIKRVEYLEELLNVKNEGDATETKKKNAPKKKKTETEDADNDKK